MNPKTRGIDFAGSKFEQNPVKKCSYREHSKKFRIQGKSRVQLCNQLGANCKNYLQIYNIVFCLFWNKRKLNSCLFAFYHSCETGWFLVLVERGFDFCFMYIHSIQGNFPCQVQEMKNYLEGKRISCSM